MMNVEGMITARLYEKETPVTVRNFVALLGESHGRVGRDAAADREDEASPDYLELTGTRHIERTAPEVVRSAGANGDNPSAH
jgi:cyclophilin family peptidyl-prolyl cis-trans isomerase